MKKYFVPLFSLAVFAFVLMGFQDANDNLSIALKTGNASEIAKNFAPNVDIAVPGNEGTFSKARAEALLKDFFSRTKTQGYVQMHQGKSKQGLTYIIGKLATDKGDLRVSIYKKASGDKELITQLRFDQE